jgi:hypothetical protein
MHLEPELHDYRPLMRGWKYCQECDRWYEPDDFATHTHFEQDADGNKFIFHHKPTRKIWQINSK